MRGWKRRQDLVSGADQAIGSRLNRQNVATQPVWIKPTRATDQRRYHAH